MKRKIRFGAFIREMAIQQDIISYNKLAPILKIDARGEYIPHRPRRLQLRGIDAYRLLQPYVSVRFMEQLKSVLPLAVYLALFQLLILRQDMDDPGIIFAGLIAVMLGLMLFMEGLKLGLMPFGETIGTILPAKSSLPVVLGIALLLGIGVTFAEPAIGALKAAGSIVSVENAPYLYTMLNDWTESLVLAVGIGVGLAAVVGTLRFLYGWSLKPLIYLTLIPTIGLTAYLMGHPDLSKILGLAWDCGAVTTGPVTVPLVLSLGIGIAAAAGKSNTSLSGFGIVTLASLFPVLAVLILGAYVGASTTPEAIIAAADAAAANIQTSEPGWFDTTPGSEIAAGLRAILPLVAFMFIVLKSLLNERVRHPVIIGYGITLCVLGMIMFSIGLSYGLAKLGEQSGSLVPAAFTSIEGIPSSPLYVYWIGLFITVVFAWLLGFGATLAEPALNALGLTVQNLTNGAFRKSTLMYAVSLGVGCGIALGVLKIVLDISLASLLIPGYLIAVALTWFSSEEYVNVAWDSAGVTTGPVTVPLVLAMGLGLGNAVDAIEGFGILSLASIGPIVSVLATGLWIQWKVNRIHWSLDAKAKVAEEGVK